MTFTVNAADGLEPRTAPPPVTLIGKEPKVGLVVPANRRRQILQNLFIDLVADLALVGLQPATGGRHGYLLVDGADLQRGVEPDHRIDADHHVGRLVSLKPGHRDRYGILPRFQVCKAVHAGRIGRSFPGFIGSLADDANLRAGDGAAR